ncbi:MAG: NADH dehydrogenase [Ignavibacteria bacterium GWB2_35_12]|nr:MAG: NADH dehydrogenase [Ignavibacteria bacterium GWA2_35_8]OGU41186.1 MAG: NADH dehydrogenase [Ignavibacteria bacterium GWB2_35_12]OGU86807.1 MAG: NADH dehydrogenase [Ignavibacteria bacterium RIFOXYA2_FULL_35_10]OGV23108.1 MAG: NADH dehydrogenase [Ignavibacteria bacterium RIFOXYC2_FULL_35_21]
MVSETKKVEFEYSQIDSERMRLNVGPQHPSTHGVLRLEVELDGEIVTEVVPHIGYLHRCFEKHAEKMTYPQVIPYIDRMDYISAMNNEWPYVMGIEKLMGIEVPEKVEYIRVIFAELNRIANHQIAIATFGLDAGAFTPFLYLFRDREFILTVFEKASGGRLLYNYYWVGGLAADVHKEFKEDVLSIVKQVRETNKEIADLLIYNKIFIERVANVGILPADVAINYGCSGPVVRGSGLPFDLRKDAPYSIYDRFDFDVVIGHGEVGTVGDCFDRNIVRFHEMEQSCRIIEQAIEQMPMDGDVREKLPKKIRPPKGEIYTKAENPKGELGFYIVSNGTDKPERIKSRGTSFVNLSVLPEISKGYLFADLIMILGSVDIVLGEVDR